MKPLFEIPEQQGRFRAPLAMLNHLFPVHLLQGTRAYMLEVGKRAPEFSEPTTAHNASPSKGWWPARAGSGWRWRAHELVLIELVTALARADSEEALNKLVELEPHADEVLTCTQSPWWMGVGAFLSARLEALDLNGQVPTNLLNLRRTWSAELFANRRRYLALREGTVQIVAALRERGIDSALLKGIVCAERWYPEPWARPLGDLDLLVAPEQMKAARACLEDLGWKSADLTPSKEARESEDDWEGHHHSAPLNGTFEGHPLVVELHHRVDADSSSAAWSALAWQRRVAVPSPVALADSGAETQELEGLDPIDGLAHAAVHHTAELGFKNLLDLCLAWLHEPQESWAMARERLPRSLSWRVDLGLGLVADCVDPMAAQLLDSHRKPAIQQACDGRWGEGYAVWMARAGGRDAPRHWLESFSPRVDEALRHPLLFGRLGAGLSRFGCYLWRQVRVVSRLCTDCLGFLFPDPQFLGEPRRATPSYLRNSARALRSLFGQFVNNLRQRS